MLGLVLISLLATAAAYRNPYPNGKTLTYDGVDAGERLLLSEFIKSGRIAEGRDLALVTGLEPNLTSYAGYITVSEECSSAMFFWFFPSQNKPETDPVSVWLQGGPGSTSFFGLLTENGPYNLRVDGTLELREYSWNRNSSIIYIDNPVGTGFSYSSSPCYVEDETAVGRDLLIVLTQFFQLFPEYSKNPFFLTGESYAGKYVPAAAYAILKANTTINLQGIMIGNGWLDPRNQSDYSSYLYQLGFVDAKTRDSLKILEDECRRYADEGDYDTSNDLSNEILDVAMDAAGLYSVYNYLQDLGDPEPNLEKFVTQPEVRAALHVGNATWHGDSASVYYRLENDIMRSVRPWFEELLENYRVLLYNGQLDIICAYPLTMGYVENLNWTGAAAYKQAEREIWQIGSSIAGYAKSAGDFTEVMVRNAGHMVPTDQPEWALDLYNKFIFNQKIAS